MHRTTNITNSDNNSYKNIPHFLTFNTDIYKTQGLTIGFLNSLGLIQRMKKGWQLLKVFISKSRDFLNWVDNVGARFLVSEPIPMSSANKSWRNLFVEIWINWRRSALKVSRFFSRNPENSQPIQVTSKKRKQLILGIIFYTAKEYVTN